MIINILIPMVKPICIYRGCKDPEGAYTMGAKVLEVSLCHMRHTKKEEMAKGPGIMKTGSRGPWRSRAGRTTENTEN